MAELHSILVGALLGFFGSIPVAGPISVLVLALAMEGRSRAAFGVAVGGAVAEAVYAFLAFWGFGTYLARYPIVEVLSRGAAFLILFVIGIMLVRTRKRASPSPSKGHVQDTGGPLLIGFMIAILNPTLILTWVAASSAVFAAHILPFSPLEALPFALGVCSGIMGWFALLLRVSSRYRMSLHPASLARIEFWMGCAVIGGAAVFFCAFLRGLLS